MIIHVLYNRVYNVWMTVPARQPFMNLHSTLYHWSLCTFCLINLISQGEYTSKKHVFPMYSRGIGGGSGGSFCCCFSRFFGKIYRYQFFFHDFCPSLEIWVSVISQIVRKGRITGTWNNVSMRQHSRKDLNKKSQIGNA